MVDGKVTGNRVFDTGELRGNVDKKAQKCVWKQNPTIPSQFGSAGSATSASLRALIYFFDMDIRAAGNKTILCLVSLFVLFCFVN